MRIRPKGATGVQATKEQKEALRALLNSEGEAHAEQRIGISRAVIGRILGGLTVRRGSLALLDLATSRKNDAAPAK